MRRSASTSFFQFGKSIAFKKTPTGNSMIGKLAYFRQRFGLCECFLILTLMPQCIGCVALSLTGSAIDR